MSPEQEALLCVFCRKHPVEAQWRPFCSERCKLQDLANWADGT
ncbi:MAG: DNA gyrase inhibitor YacG, partial [Vicinamibacterales bacterium]